MNRDREAARVQAQAVPPPDPVATGPRSGAAPGPAAGPAHVMDPVERTVHLVLRLGVAVSFVLLAAGLALGAAHGRGLSLRVVSPGELPAALVELRPAAYISLGLVVLIATPFIRVAGSLVAFLHERDRRYALVTAAVLVVMLVSVLVGRA